MEKRLRHGGSVGGGTAHPRGLTTAAAAVDHPGCQRAAPKEPVTSFFSKVPETSSYPGSKKLGFILSLPKDPFAIRGPGQGQHNACSVRALTPSYTAKGWFRARMAPTGTSPICCTRQPLSTRHVTLRVQLPLAAIEFDPRVIGASKFMVGAGWNAITRQVQTKAASPPILVGLSMQHRRSGSRQCSLGLGLYIKQANDGSIPDCRCLPDVCYCRSIRSMNRPKR